MITLFLLTGVFVVGAALAINPQLAADVRLAMKRADLTLDYVSRVTGIPPQRLSDQLNAKTPFTGFWRFFAGEMLATDFRGEFLELQAERINRMVTRADVGRLLACVEALVGAKPMAKMPARAFTHVVDLPLLGRKERA